MASKDGRARVFVKFEMEVDVTTSTSKDKLEVAVTQLVMHIFASAVL